MIRSAAGTIGRDDMTTSSRERDHSLILCPDRRSVTPPSFPDHFNSAPDLNNPAFLLIRKPFCPSRLKITRTHPAPLITSISDRTSPSVVTIELAQRHHPNPGAQQ